MNRDLLLSKKSKGVSSTVGLQVSIFHTPCGEVHGLIPCLFSVNLDPSLVFGNRIYCSRLVQGSSKVNGLLSIDKLDSVLFKIESKAYRAF